MNRTMVSGIAAFALLFGAIHAMSASTAEAGLLSKHRANKACGEASHCGGGHVGILARHRARRGNDCCAPAPEPCCEPAPETCCAPEPAPAPCCAPAPEPCCAPAPEPCCAPEPAPCCDSGSRRGHGCKLLGRLRARRSGGCCDAPAVEAAPCCGDAVAAPAVSSGCSSCGDSVGAVVADGGGFDLAPGETLVPGSTTSEAAVPAAVPESSSDSAPEGGDAEVPPPAPVPDASTDA